MPKGFRRIFKTLLLVLLIGSSLAPGAEIGFEWRDKGRSFLIEAPGLELGEMHFSGVLRIDDKWCPLDSRQGKPMGTKILEAQPGPYGKTSATISTVRFEEFGIELLLRVDRLEGVPCVMLNTGVRNLRKRPVTLAYLQVLNLPKNPSRQAEASWAGAGSLKDWILTAQDPAILTKTFADLENPIMLWEEFGVYRKDGAGVFIGPVGEPVAYVRAKISRDSIFVEPEMLPSVIPPGKLRWGQQVGLFFEPPWQAMCRWADWVARTHGARTSQGAITGWMDAFSDIQRTEKEVGAAIDCVRTSRSAPRPQAIVLDQVLDSPGQSPENISRQLPRFAERIAAVHAMPGLRLTLDDNSKQPEENLGTIRDSVAMGYRFLKLLYNFSATGTEEQNLTVFERNRKQFQEIRSAAGESTYLLSCNIRAKRAGLGFVDSTRSGPNNMREGIRGVIDNTLWAYPLNRRWYAVDSDVCYLATELSDVSPLAGGWPMARTWLSLVGLSCGNAFTADDWYLPKFQPYIRNFEILNPPAREETQILDLGTAAKWPRLAGKVTRPWGSWTVALLWNPRETERSISLDFAQIGARPGSRYAVWSFWDNAYFGVMEGTYTAQFLAASASQHLVFTELPRDSKKPILIGSNFHIYCGAAEIKNVTALESGMAIEFTDAGAASGSLCVYSPIQPVLSSATGCEVTAIESAGENVWRIDIRNRAFASPQVVELRLPLPLLRQNWFWAFTGLLVASMGFGIWKYFDGVRSRRALAQDRLLHEERGRIARDLHDELGASLAQISMLGDRMAHPGEAPGGVIQRIQKNSKESLRRLDEIVWAVNPERDSVEHLATYLSKFAQEFLADSGIRFRSEIPDELPPCVLSSKLRHNLYLATREAFRNAVRHGHPATIVLKIFVGADELRIAIEDDGCGFDLAKAETPGQGLTNMRTRMQAIGGRFSISSHPGQGCAILLTLPLHAKLQP
ncbi:MAG: hypothetical protein RL630_1339 [Verrucomicrobiota bacterium]|jgi:signal transduction histidine kinase